MVNGIVSLISFSTRIDAFEVWCWRRLLRVPWTARRSALGFLWREWCWSWNSSILATSYEELTHWKRLWCWEGLGAGGEGDNRGWDGWMTSMDGWLNGHEFEWTPGVGDRQGGLACCNSWGHKESDRTERLHWTERSKSKSTLSSTVKIGKGFNR